MEINFTNENPWKTFSLKRKSRNWNLLTGKPRKLISFMGKLQKPTPTTGTWEQFNFIAEISRKADFNDSNSMRTNLSKGKWRKKFAYKISLEIGFNNKNSVKIVPTGRNSMETKWIELKSFEMIFIDGGFVQVFSIQIRSMQTAFIKGATKTEPTYLTGTPGEPISFQCNAWKLNYGTSLELDKVDEKSMGINFSYQKARRTKFIHV